MDKKYLKRVALYVFAAVFSVGMILYIGYHLWNGITSKITTSPALQVSRSFTVRADAYIVMSESSDTRVGDGQGIPRGRRCLPRRGVFDGRRNIFEHRRSAARGDHEPSGAASSAQGLFRRRAQCEGGIENRPPHIRHHDQDEAARPRQRHRRRARHEIGVRPAR